MPCSRAAENLPSLTMEAAQPTLNPKRGRLTGPGPGLGAEGMGEPHAMVCGSHSRLSSEMPDPFWAVREGQRDAWKLGMGRGEPSREHTL